MRTLIVALSFFLFSGAAHHASAYYYDDSVVIEIGDGVPSETSSTPPSGDPGDPSSGGSIESTAPGVGSSNGSAGAQGSSGGGDTNFVNNSSGTGDSASAGGSIPNDSGGAPASLFDLLVTQGAITGGGTQNPDANSNAGVGAGGVNAGASSGEETTINAAKLREALRGKDSFRDILEDYRSGYRAGAYRMVSARDIGLMGASTVLGDINIDELTFGTTQFEMVYRSRGYLLGFIPKTFPVRIAVSPQASISQERVVLTLPWYRFLLRKLFNTSVLAREIEAIVTADVRLEHDTPADVQIRLFEAVSLALKQKIGAIGISQ